MRTLPVPATTPPFGHLWRWVSDPLPLLTEGAAAGSVFELRLWRRAVVGYRPDWNRFVLGDLDLFRSRGSLSGLTPYLSHGVVYTDVPSHSARRAQLNPHFHSKGLAPLVHRVEGAAAADVPEGRFDALPYASAVVRRMLNAAFFAGRVSDRLLAAFLSPLDRPMPQPLLPRPRLFRRLDAAIASVLSDPPPSTLAAYLATLPGAVEEIRVALAAGYDTTAHTLAWALWHVADPSGWRTPVALPAVIDEVLRLYPAGWVGSRLASRDTSFGGVPIAAGTLVLYSPYLTHRDPSLWKSPDAFDPARFDDGRPAWGFIPFAAGRRTCLGTHLARIMLTAALEPFCAGPLVRVGGDAGIRSGLTLRPAGPLHLDFRGRR